MDDRIFEFTALLEGVSDGGPNYCVVYLPADIAEQLTFGRNSRLRVSVEMEGCQFEAAWMPSRGRWYLMLSKKRRKEMGLEIGDCSVLRFSVVDQDAVEVPRALLNALQAESGLEAIWNAQTSGKRRSWCYRIAGAKRETTQAARIEDCLDWLRSL